MRDYKTDVGLTVLSQRQQELLDELLPIIDNGRVNFGSLIDDVLDGRKNLQSLVYDMRVIVALYIMLDTLHADKPAPSDYDSFSDPATFDTRPINPLGKVNE
jgi:predicted DNA-binding ribbon-helix-helix protein